VRAALAAVALAACGRVGFEPQRVLAGDAATIGDAPPPVVDAPSPVVDAMGLPTGPALWLKMETDPGTGIVDSVGSHVTTCTGAFCPASITGLHGRSYRFTGQELDVAYAADLDASHGFTAALWVQLTALPATESACVFNMPFNDANGWDTFAICIDVGGATQFDSETPTGNADLETGPTIALAVWHHLAQSWDGTTKRGYLDGVEVASKVIAVGAGTQAPTLGGSRGAFFLTGTIDDAMYYTRALSAAEVAQLATP